LSEADLLTDEEWLREMHRYILGSFPLGWADAKMRLLRDRQVRTMLMRQETQEDLQHLAFPPPEEDPAKVVDLLAEAAKYVPEGELLSEIRLVLEAHGVEDG
jgi:hypothetical protein